MENKILTFKAAIKSSLHSTLLNPTEILFKPSEISNYNTKNLEPNTEYLYRITPYKQYFQSVLFVTFLGVATLVTIKFLIKYDLFYRSTIVFFSMFSFMLLFLKRV